MSPPISKSAAGAGKLHHNNRFDDFGRDLRDYRTYIPTQRSGLSHVEVPAEESPALSVRSPSSLSESSIYDDLILDAAGESPGFGDFPSTESAWETDFDVNEATMSLPGLGLDEPDETVNVNSTGYGTGGTAQSQTQQYNLQSETEWRFELAPMRSITIKVVSGSAELFATELVVGHPYTFTSTKAAIFTWNGCTLEVTSDYGPLTSALTSEYVAEETSCNEYINLHFSLEQSRTQALNQGTDGPRILIVGPESSGKSSLAKTIIGYGIRAGRSPMVVNLDPAEGVLSLPGTLTATVFNSLIEIEQGWGNAPMSGPNGEIPVKQPLVYYYGSMNPEDKNGTIFKSQIRQLALGVSGKMATDPATKSSGLVVDTPGALVNARAASGGYDLLTHILSEFGIDTIVCLGSERLYSDMVKRFDGTPISRSSPLASTFAQNTETISVVKLTKSGGVAERDAAYMQAVRQAQTKLYFYGNGKSGAGIVLQPRQQQVDFDTLTIWRRISSSGPATSLATSGGSGGPTYDEDSFLPGGAEDSDTHPAASMVPLPASQIFERLTAPLPALRNCVLAVMNCPGEPDSGAEQETLRDSSVMGFLYVTEVDETRRRISLLSPVAGRVPERALVWGEGIDGVLGLT